ncbi:HAD family hydrolase [Pararhizobium mangrovi]|uniref:HAD family hydrolase n=1 Tax=Pararhizobium mangrovi TaxID=2590452 RepID=A0A506U2V3_9HYPH|nr:HAD family hydrolase [Pararhizobium mangrovi]TPW28692.1 HAD family hydrolase [Pararhizobium mangrovi]
MAGFDLIIFDCDGVLVDSEIIAAKVEAKLLTDAGHPIEAETVMQRYAGMTWKDVLLAIEKEADHPLPATLLKDSERILDEKLAREVRAIEGVGQAIARIDLPRCICSNSAQHRIEAMLKRTRLLPVFEPDIFSAKDLEGVEPKPAPDVYLHAARQMDKDAAATVVVEDSAHGVQAARAAGMRVVGFTGGAHTWPSHADVLTEAGAETVINRMRDLPPTVEALSAWSEPV